MYNYSSSSVIQKFQKNAKHQMLHSVLTSIEAAATQCLIFTILPHMKMGSKHVSCHTFSSNFLLKGPSKPLQTKYKLTHVS